MPLWRRSTHRGKLSHPDVESYTRSSPWNVPTTSFRPSGLNAIARGSGTGSDKVSWPEATSQCFTVPSGLQVAKREPSALIEKRPT